MNLRVSFDRVTRPNCNETVKYPLDWSTLYYLEVKVNGSQVLLVEEATTTFIDGSTSADPSNTDVLLINIPLVNIWDSADVQIIARHVEGSGDFSDDFSDDFSIGYINKYEYINTFKVFGYDLGNNGVDITTNPNFIINFLVNSLGDIGSPEFMLTDFNDDFNEDFATFCNCYSDFIAYRRPLTDFTYVYDSVSSWVEPEEKHGERVIEYYDEKQCLLGNTRNIIVCRKPTFLIYQKVVQLITTYEDSHCGCAPATILVQDKSCNTEMRKIPEVIYKWKPMTYSTDHCGQCGSECCEVIVGVENQVYISADIAPMTWYYVDDAQKNLYNQIQVTYEVVTYNGFVIDEHEIVIDTSTVYYYFDSSVTEWQYTMPDMGDFVIRTTFEYQGYVEDPETEYPATAVRCVTNLQLKACNWYEVKQTGCNEYTVYNRSFNAFTVQVDVMDDAPKEFISHSSYTVPALGETVITLNDDNVYTFTVERDAQKNIFVVINYCKLRECLLGKVIDALCAGPEGRCQEKEYYEFNKLAIHMHTYFSMLVTEYNFNYIYTALLPNKVLELHGVKQMLDKMNKLCNKCGKLKNCGCGCS